MVPFRLLTILSLVLYLFYLLCYPCSIVHLFSCGHWIFSLCFILFIGGGTPDNAQGLMLQSYSWQCWKTMQYWRSNPGLPHALHFKPPLQPCLILIPIVIHLASSLLSTTLVVLVPGIYWTTSRMATNDDHPSRYLWPHIIFLFKSQLKLVMYF